MPYKCCVPGCKGNYTGGPKVRCFSFPTDKNLLKQWLSAIPRGDYTPTRHTKVCEQHFADTDIVRSITEQDPLTGRFLTVSLKLPRLKPNVVPCKFPKSQACPSTSTSRREEANQRLPKVEEITIEEVFLKEESANLEYQNSTCLFTFCEFVNALNSYRTPEGWSKIVEDEKVAFLKLKHSPGPVITYAVHINSNLQIETFLLGQGISITINNKKTPFVLTNISDITNILNILSNLANETDHTQGNKKNKFILNQVSDILNNVLAEFSEADQSALSFIMEQINLHTVSGEKRKYSTNMMILSSLLYTVSPHAYEFLRSANALVLPEPKVIKAVCNSVLSDPKPEEKRMFLTYARNQYKLLDENEKYMILLMDEIHIQASLSHKGNNSFRTALPTTAYVFTVKGVKSEFNELVHIAPVSKIDYVMLFNFIRTLIVKLERTGYKIFCIITQNNALNIEAMNGFSPTTRKLSIVYPHPVESWRPLFYMFDSAHILRCIRNDWLNCIPDQTLNYPAFQSGEERRASFDSVKELYTIDHDKLLKFGHSLNLKAAFPTSMVNSNLKLSLELFNEFIIQALLQLGANIKHSKETANFIKIILTWWKIVDVKTPFEGGSLKDEYQEPVVKTNRSKDRKISYLNNVLVWLDNWNSNFSSSYKLTAETHTAFAHTVYGILEIINYCFDELHMNFVLLGKFQINPLEDKFAKRHQLGGGLEHVSIRQSYETEKRLKIQSLLTLKSKRFGAIQIQSFSEDIDMEVVEEPLEFSFCPDISIEQEDVEKVKNEMPAITYLAGYCSYVTLTNFKCEVCTSNLVLMEHLIVEDRYSLIKHLDPGCLLYPKEVVTDLVMYQYIVFNKILEDYEEDFMNINYSQALLKKFVLQYATEQGLLIKFKGCTSHSEKSVAEIIIRCTTNTLFKNYTITKTEKLSTGRKRKKIAEDASDSC